MSEVRQFRAKLSDEELRAINTDAAKRGIDRVEWFTRAIKESRSWRALLKGAKP